MTEMRGYTTNYVNQIYANLRDRYDNGFPILKELIQNADDAEAKSFVFGSHPGFLGEHPLLCGPGLWFFNDGKFKKEDAQSLRSFGINAKAGDSNAIGKFGLGMKSVFHLCEALFYVAWDGSEIHYEGLTPWKSAENNPRPEWDETSKADWQGLENFARSIVAGHEQSWFLLWIPLRQKRHLLNAQGIEKGAIVRRFPGDDPAHDLGFLDQAGPLLAEILPLLRHLERIEHRADSYPFVLELKADQRLLMAADSQNDRQSVGTVTLSQDKQPLTFAGLRRVGHDSDGVFLRLREHDKWPRTWYLDEDGHEQETFDKTKPEGAVMFCSGPETGANLDIHWAVFLPLEHGTERRPTEPGERSHRLVLHGQFFIDAGRKGISGFDSLSESQKLLEDDAVDETTLQTTWNRLLAQQVLLPLVLPALEHYASTAKLSDKECELLTHAIQETHWFRRYKRFLCANSAWVRALENGDKPAWRHISSKDVELLRPLPKPPQSEPQRPWEVFPQLAKMAILPFDQGASSLVSHECQWSENEIHELLSDIPDVLAGGSPQIRYLTSFLSICAGPYRGTQKLRNRVIALVREGFRSNGLDNLSQRRSDIRQLVELIPHDFRRPFSGKIPPKFAASLWSYDASVLLIPKDLDAEETPGKAIPDETTLAHWLGLVDKELQSEISPENMEALLGFSQELLKSLETKTRGEFLRIRPNLRILAVRDAKTSRDIPVSLEGIERARRAGTLFGFAQGRTNDERLGYTNLLSKVLPSAEIFLVKIEIYKEIFPDEKNPPRADDQLACLIAVGKDESGKIGSINARRNLLENASDPGGDADAHRGLRYLLHGSPENRTDVKSPLWIPGREHSAWAKLWRAIYEEDGSWRLIDGSLAGIIGDSRLQKVNTLIIEPNTLIDDLKHTNKGITDPYDFTIVERDEILSKISDRDVWLRLPFHQTIDEKLTSTCGDGIYLADTIEFIDDPLTSQAIIIRPSIDPTVREQQRQWLKPLDDRARIEIALKSDEPVKYWQTILNALRQIEADDFPTSLVTVSWMPTRDDGSVAPEDVIDIPHMQDEIQRLIATHRVSQGDCFASITDLASDLREHHNFNHLRDNAFSRNIHGIKRLALLLEKLPDYHIGNWSSDLPSHELVSLLSDCDCLLGWRLLMVASQDSLDLEDVWEHLRLGIARTLSYEKLVSVLDWLARNTENWDNRKAAYDQYLKEFSETRDFSLDNLAERRLANQYREWRSPDELCMGAHGVDKRWLLDKRQARLLQNILHNDNRPSAYNDGIDVGIASFDLIKNATPKILQDHFRSWSGLVPAPMIGMILALMGKELRVLAESMLKPHGFDWLTSRLSWQDPRLNNVNRYNIDRWMAGKCLTEALELIVVGAHTVKGDSIAVSNLMGASIKVPLDETPKSLLAGPLNWMGGYSVEVRLRVINPSDYSRDQLSELLRGTAEILYDGFYNQRTPNFESLWKELDLTGQLEIGVARKLILDSIPLYLRQLSVSNENLKDLLIAYDKYRTLYAEAEADNLDTSEARRNLNTSLAELAKYLDEDEETQEAVLEAVRRKLGDYQYDETSIAFELFQNADDAVIELGNIEAHPAEGYDVPKGSRHFIIKVTENNLRFMHWGRPVNAQGPLGFEGDRKGFGRDLEKMLILSASDKQSDRGTTGKFGLGFKSVLLVCERPRIVSAGISVEVVAGILPQIWKENQTARNCLSGYSPEQRLQGTLIELADITSLQQAKILARFSRLAGVLSVFARAIRSISLVNAHEQSFNWIPTEIALGVEHGRFKLSEPGKTLEIEALCLRRNGDSECLLLALGPEGFRSLPEDVPAIWVTAPTREKAHVGFAINGAFELDPGRGNLPSQSESNSLLAKQIGRKAGEALATLFDEARNDWISFARRLNLSAELNAHDFWLSIWQGLTEEWLNKRPLETALELTRLVVIELLSRLGQVYEAIPNGLASPAQKFISIQDIKFEFSEDLASSDSLALLYSWKPFADKYPASDLVSEEIGLILKQTDIAKPKKIGLPALIALVDNYQVQPEDAHVLGQLLSRETLDESKDSKELKSWLKKLKFLSKAGIWSDPSHLLASDEDFIEVDELLRHDIAPESRCLHPGYYLDINDNPSIEFFLVCRGNLDAPAKDIAEWILNAPCFSIKRAALIYLARGRLRQEVGDIVRNQGWLCEAPYDPDLLDSLELDDQKNIKRILATDDQIDRGLQEDVLDESKPSVQPKINLATALERIYSWWSREGAYQGNNYRNRLYPGGTINLHDDPESGEVDRASWLILFALGAFQNIGRTKDEQHRGFISMCQQRGWWQTFSEIDPRKRPDQWMEIIEEYAQNNDEEWTIWIGQFPKLYRLSRWLDDYVELFKSINRYEQPFSINQLRTPRANPQYQGGGIDPPPIERTLANGVHLVIRELLYHEIIQSPFAIPHAYAPIERIRDLFGNFGEEVDRSEDIHELLKKHLSPEQVIFNGAYDIPLRIIAGSDDLQRQLFE